MDRIILIGVDQGVMIGGRFDGWLAHLTHAGWVTIRKLDEADPYASLPDALRQSQCTELGAVGPATGVSLGQSAHDAEKRRRNFLSQFPAVNAQELHENMLAATASLSPAATSDGAEPVAWRCRFKDEPAHRREDWTLSKVKPMGDDLEIEALGVLAKPASSPAGGDVAPGLRADIAHDGFSGDIIGRYVTREGKRGAVVQQDGTRVVHVYGEKWLPVETQIALSQSTSGVGE